MIVPFFRRLTRSLVVCLLPGALPLSLRADAVLDWTSVMIDGIRIDTTGPTLSTRNLAILHVAIYEAVNNITRTHQPYFQFSDPPAGAYPEAAAMGAAYTVVKALYPAMRGRADDLYESYMAGEPPAAALTNSIAFGAGIAAQMLENRGDDGSATQVPYIPSDLPGQWRRTPPFYRPPLDPQWRYVTPFCLPEIEPFVPPGPPALDSARYAADFNQVKTLGAKNSSVRTPEQSQIAVFWSDFSYTAMPPGHWHEIAIDIARNQTNSLPENARLFALLSLAQADGAIVCWEAKYRYNSWRPITAIQRADEDGNPATDPDPNWNHFLNSPNFPEHTSGHSTFSKASATILSDFYRTDHISFTAASDSLPGVFRSFTSLSACADEIGMSRIYGGIHFLSANLDGKACGAKIADYIFHNWLLPVENLPCLTVEPVTGGAPRVRAHALAGGSCVVEASYDLITWTPISTNSATAGGSLVADPDGAGHGTRFFRVRAP